MKIQVLKGVSEFLHDVEKQAQNIPPVSLGHAGFNSKANLSL